MRKNGVLLLPEWHIASPALGSRAGFKEGRFADSQVGGISRNLFVGLIHGIHQCVCVNCSQAFTPEVVLRATAPGLALVAYGACARLIVSGPQTMFSWHMSFLIIGLLSGTRYCACCLTPSSPEGRGPSLGGQWLAKATSSASDAGSRWLAGVKRLLCTKPLTFDSFLETEIRATCWLKRDSVYQLLLEIQRGHYSAIPSLAKILFFKLWFNIFLLLSRVCLLDVYSLTRYAGHLILILSHLCPMWHHFG